MSEAGADSAYVIRTGNEALDRLELIARLCWPATDAFLTRTGADRVDRFLDVGCGIGDVACRVAERGGTTLGIDVNGEVIEAAKARADRVGSTAEFRTVALDTFGTGPDSTGFDTVYARCVLSHLPDPVPAAASLVAAARPGGRVLIEDVEVAAIWCSPRCDALTRHIELYVAAARGLGARPDVGPELADALARAGATDIEVDVVQPMLRVPEDIQVHARTMEAIAGPVIDQGLATREEVDELVAQLDAWAKTPGVVATLPRFVQVSGRVAG